MSEAEGSATPRRTLAVTPLVPRTPGVAPGSITRSDAPQARTWGRCHSEQA
jgi:hypothetical protein